MKIQNETICYLQEQRDKTLVWELLPQLKAYLKEPSMDGRSVRQEMRKKMAEIIERVDDLQKKIDENTDW